MKETISKYRVAGFVINRTCILILLRIYIVPLLIILIKRLIIFMQVTRFYLDCIVYFSLIFVQIK